MAHPSTSKSSVLPGVGARHGVPLQWPATGDSQESETKNLYSSGAFNCRDSSLRSDRQPMSFHFRALFFDFQFSNFELRFSSSVIHSSLSILQLRIPRFHFRISIFEFLVSSFRFRVSIFEFRVSSFRVGFPCLLPAVLRPRAPTVPRRRLARRLLRTCKA